MMPMNRDQRRAMAKEQAQTAMQPPTQELVTMPVPTNVNVDTAVMGDGSQAVRVRMLTPLGVQDYYFPPDITRQIAGFLEQKAAEASSGLVVAPAGAIPILGEHG